jgi:hypothetical protein
VGPSLNAVFGGVLIFSGLHVWTADTPTPPRAAWVKNLEAIAAQAGRDRAGPPRAPMERWMFRQ